MSISEKIKNALADISLQNYFITRANDKTECIVYNYIEKPSRMADNEEKATMYTVMLNLYCKSNVENNKKLIINAMQKSGFMRKSVASTVVVDSGFFCTAITFAISIDK